MVDELNVLNVAAPRGGRWHLLTVQCILARCGPPDGGLVPTAEIGNTGQVAKGRRAAIAAVVRVGLLAYLSITAAGPVAAAAEAFVPVLDWHPCAAPGQQGFD